MTDDRQAGFGLIEILVAVVIFGILTTSVFYFLTSQNKMGVRSNDMLKGLNVGKHKMDSLKVVPYADLESGSDTVSTRYIRAWRVTQVRDALGVPNGRKEIEITVYWPLTADHNVAFTTLVSDDKYKEGP
jgi:prepilin-type N-terminal cleavage/methylation domain-containing protein